MRPGVVVAMGWLSLLLGCSSEPPFARDGEVWRYRGLVLAEVDAASFRPLGEHHGRDAANAWFVDTFRESSDYFTTRRLRLTRIAGADLATFEAIDDEHARDAARVYHQGRPFAVADVAGFVPLDGMFARDRVQGYYRRTPVAGSDGKTFAALSSNHAGDARRVWWCDLEYPSREGLPRPRCTVVEGADPARFEVLARGYARSGDRVFHESRWLRDADAASFAVDELGSGADAHDRRGPFQDGRRVAQAAPAMPAASVAAR